jgi:hypothetical protein
MDLDVVDNARQAALRAAVAAQELEQALRELADARPGAAYRENQQISDTEFLLLDFSDANAAWGARYTSLLLDVAGGGLLLWMTSSDSAKWLRVGQRIVVARGRVQGLGAWALQQRAGGPVMLPRLQNARLA